MTMDQYQQTAKELATIRQRLLDEIDQLPLMTDRKQLCVLISTLLDTIQLEDQLDKE